MNRTKKVVLKDIDALVISSPSNLFYFTGYTNVDAVLIISHNESYYISDSRVAEEFGEFCPGVQFVQIGNGKTYYEKAIDVLKELKAKHIGYEEDDMLFKNYVLFDEFFEMLRFSNQIAMLRSIKDDFEIEQIISAQSITDTVFHNVLNYINPGITELELTNYINSNIFALGGSLAFDTIVAFGRNTSKPHAHPGKNILQTKDIVTIDFGAKFNGYCSDMTRSFCVGKPSDRYINTYNLVLEAQCNAINQMKAGLTGQEIDALARNYFPSSIAKYFTHSLGHSFGIDIHERPSLSPLYTGIINKNVVTSVEPGLYYTGDYGVRIEDIVLVKENGVQNLTKSPKKLIII
ncbi:MAG TPA: aminopeptidase P family protein [Clostridia bacterium]|jgi:Xaa-Pro aminopeptidase|nr:aminopeptidase P family protein [Clostridia bacterium]